MQTLDPLRDFPSIRKTEPAGANRLTVKKFAAEFWGTFALVFAGTGAIVINEVSGGAVTHAGIALTFGLIVLAMIYTVGDVSGAHLNPAVSMHFQSLWIYLTAPVCGALLAVPMCRLIRDDQCCRVRFLEREFHGN
jgi:glycerol uptake facilitator-like aquaporin